MKIGNIDPKLPSAKSLRENAAPDSFSGFVQSDAMEKTEAWLQNILDTSKESAVLDKLNAYPEFHNDLAICEFERMKSFQSLSDWMGRLAANGSNRWVLYLPQHPPASVLEPLLAIGAPIRHFDIVLYFCKTMNPVVPPHTKKQIRMGDGKLYNTPDTTFLTLCVKYECTELVKGLFKYQHVHKNNDIDVNSFYYDINHEVVVPLIWVSALLGDLDTLRVLINEGANINAHASTNIWKLLPKPREEAEKYAQKVTTLREFVDEAVGQGQTDLILVQKMLTRVPK